MYKQHYHSPSLPLMTLAAAALGSLLTATMLNTGHPVGPAIMQAISAFASWSGSVIANHSRYLSALQTMLFAGAAACLWMRYKSRDSFAYSRGILVGVLASTLCGLPMLMVNPTDLAGHALIIERLLTALGASITVCSALLYFDVG